MADVGTGIALGTSLKPSIPNLEAAARTAIATDMRRQAAEAKRAADAKKEEERLASFVRPFTTPLVDEMYQPYLNNVSLSYYKGANDIKNAGGGKLEQYAHWTYHDQKGKDVHAANDALKVSMQNAPELAVDKELLKRIASKNAQSVIDYAENNPDRKIFQNSQRITKENDFGIPLIDLSGIKKSKDRANDYKNIIQEQIAAKTNYAVQPTQVPDKKSYGVSLNDNDIKNMTVEIMSQKPAVVEAVVDANQDAIKNDWHEWLKQNPNAPENVQDDAINKIKAKYVEQELRMHPMTKAWLYSPAQPRVVPTTKEKRLIPTDYYNDAELFAQMVQSGEASPAQAVQQFAQKVGGQVTPNGNGVFLPAMEAAPYHLIPKADIWVKQLGGNNYQLFKGKLGNIAAQVSGKPVLLFKDNAGNEVPFGTKDSKPYLKVYFQPLEDKSIDVPTLSQSQISKTAWEAGTDGAKELKGKQFSYDYPLSSPAVQALVGKKYFGGQQVSGSMYTTATKTTKQQPKSQPTGQTKKSTVSGGKVR